MGHRYSGGRCQKDKFQGGIIYHGMVLRGGKIYDSLSCFRLCARYAVEAGVVLSCIIFEIKQDIGLKWRFCHITLHSRLPL